MDSTNADVAPGPNPSNKEINPENELYRAWKEASQEVRPDIERRLLQHLRRHASKVCWMVLHSHQPDIVTEVAQDAILELAKFEERSSFATWFHSRAFNRFRNELRRQKIRKEVTLDVTYSIEPARHPLSPETRVLVHELFDSLTAEERQLVELKVFDDLTDQEVSEALNCSRSAVQLAWTQLRTRLREKYGKVR